MGATFGTRLRLQRERQQISLASIADQTKIRLPLLEALERGDASAWPRGIFGRSYIRAYARAVGLDPDATVREFLECHPEPVESLPAVLGDSRDIGPDKVGRPPIRLQVLIDSAIDAFHARRAEAVERAAPATDRRAPAVPVDMIHPRHPSPSDNARPFHVGMWAIADVCTKLGCAREAHELRFALEEASRVLDDVGLILWMPDARRATLTPVFAHGYSDEVLSRLPPLFTDADNATAAAFRTHTTCIVNASDFRYGAVVAPLLTPTGCTGVLALELRNGAEQREDVRASVTILAAQMSTLVGVPAHVQTLSA
jgi:transcriptional regulator with XRE-family HTH domain